MPTHFISDLRPRLAAVLAGLVVCLTACHSAQKQAVLDAAAYPPDFALVFQVRGTSANADEQNAARHRPAQHVLEPGGILRVAMGSGVTDRYHPPASRHLHHREVAQLYELAEAAGLTEPQTPATPTTAKASRNVVYRVTVTASGQTNRSVLNADEHPAATRLLDELVRLRSER